MGYPENDIDQLIERGELPGLLTKLNGFIGAREGSGLPVSLVPQAENPDGQLRNLVAVTRLYGKFANGEDPNAHEADVDEVDDDQAELGSDADDIRAAALKLYIEPARQLIKTASFCSITPAASPAIVPRSTGAIFGKC